MVSCLFVGTRSRDHVRVLRMRTIENLDHRELAPYLTMRQQTDHYRDRLFVAEGRKVVERLLESELEVVSALMPPEQFEFVRPWFERRTEEIDVFLAPKRALESMTGFSMYQGFLACGRIPPPAELDVTWQRAGSPRFLVATDGLTNAENLGGLVRNAAAFGAQALIVGETCVHPYLRRAVRASMGNVFRLPVVEPVSLADALRELRRRGVRCVAAHPHAGQRTLPQARLAGDACVVLGSEGEGISEEVREACDEQVAVPMQPGVDSLNVNSAAAVFFYEVWRQRARATPPSVPSDASANDEHAVR